jgi:hypothetical protein
VTPVWTRRFAAFIAFLLAGSGLCAAAPARASSSKYLAGQWQTIVPVLVTNYMPSASTVTTGTYSGVGSTSWRGDFTGVTEYTIQGTVDLVTGAGKGTLQETFAGRSADGAVGTLVFKETYIVNESSIISIRARIVKGAGDFAGAHGWMRFEGQLQSVVAGHGIFWGRWVR